MLIDATRETIAEGAPGAPEGALNPEILFERYTAARGVLVAVSGGPDSMALLALAARWARVAGRPVVWAATVDHGLRAVSRDEAERVAGWAKALGVDHRILTWDGAKPGTRIQEKAREARYALLDGYASERGADVLWTAHHADDQVETILFRLRRGSGIAGLGGMGEQVKRGRLCHARPLLGVAKSALIDFCTKGSQEFIVDPSNADPRYARTRSRRLAGLLDREGIGREELLRLAERARRAEAALTVMADSAMAIFTPIDGGFRASAAALAELPREIVLRLVTRHVELLSTSGDREGSQETIRGPNRGPRLEQAEELIARLFDVFAGGGRFASNLGGALIRCEFPGAVTIVREPPRRPR